MCEKCINRKKEDFLKNTVLLNLQIIDQIHEPDAHKRKKDLSRREGYWQHELSTFVPMGLNTRDEAASAS